MSKVKSFNKVSTRVIVTGYKLKENWAIRRVDSWTWQAWIRDEDDPDTGAPLVEGLSFEDVIDKIENFEKGAEYALHID